MKNINTMPERGTLSVETCHLPGWQVSLAERNLAEQKEPIYADPFIPIDKSVIGDWCPDGPRRRLIMRMISATINITCSQ